MGWGVGGCVNVPGTCVLDAGTQVLDRSWLELKGFLGNKFPVSLKVAGHRMVDPAISDLVFEFVYLQSVMSATPNEFYSLKRLLKATWLPNARHKKKDFFQPLIAGMCETTQFLWDKWHVCISPYYCEFRKLITCKQTNSWGRLETTFDEEIRMGKNMRNFHQWNYAFQSFFDLCIFFPLELSTWHAPRMRQISYRTTVRYERWN